MIAREKAYDRLKENLVDMVIEEQAKLGYAKEAIRLYYPLSSLNNFFENDYTKEEMEEVLFDFPSYVLEPYGKVEISRQKERFCFFLSGAFSEYVHNSGASNAFIFSLVQMVSKHSIKMDEIIALFRQFGEIEVKEIRSDDFDILIQFKNQKDRYYYCFKDEGCHIIYHRFLPEDFEL